MGLKEQLRAAECRRGRGVEVGRQPAPEERRNCADLRGRACWCINAVGEAAELLILLLLRQHCINAVGEAAELKADLRGKACWCTNAVGEAAELWGLVHQCCRRSSRIKTDSRTKKGNQQQASSMYLSEPKNRSNAQKTQEIGSYSEEEICICESKKAMRSLLASFSKDTFDCAAKLMFMQC